MDEEITPRMEAIFDIAVEHAQRGKFTEEQKLKLYGLHKHITIGVCVDKPKMMNHKAFAKFEAWKNCSNLKVSEAVEEYIALVAELDSTFKPDSVKGLDEEERPGVADLNSLPLPPRPKGLNNKYFHSTKNSSGANVLLEMQKQSGFDPENDTYDDPDRIELHERLVFYYRTVDANRLVKGIGEIVDFGVNEGVQALNKRLKTSYGIDLTELESKQRRRSSFRAVPTRPPPATIFRESNLQNLTPEEAEILSGKIEQFFSIFDPEKVKRGIDNGFIDLVLYIDKRGEDSLNKKLIKKYGRCLKDVNVDEGVPYESLRGSVERMSKPGLKQMSTKSSMSLIRGGDAFSRISQQKLEVLRKQSKSSKSTRARSKSELAAFEIDLPEYIKPALVNYYLRYDPNKLRDGKVKKIYKWAKRNGLRKLNKELKRRYHQSLDDFIEECDKLRVELVSFYKTVDETKINDGLDKIHSWGIKNGRTALNQKFRKKYGFDLDTYTDMPATGELPSKPIRY